MALYTWQKIITNTTTNNIVYDAVSNSVWCMETVTSGSLFRIRASDGAYLDANANVTNLAGATFTGGNYYAGASGIAGRKLYVGTQQAVVRRFSADTGAFEYQYPTAYYPTSAYNAVTVNDVCWFSNSAQGVPSLDGIQGFDANGNISFWSCQGGRPSYLATDGTHIYFVCSSSSDGKVWKINPADGVVTSAVVLSATYLSAQLVSISCDGTYLWLGTGSNGYIWKVRCSDLAPIDTDGNVCTAASNGNRFALRNGALYVSTAYSSIYDGSVIWVAPGTVEKQFEIVDPLTGYCGVTLWGPGVTSGSSKVPILTPGYVWFPIDNGGDIWRVRLLGPNRLTTISASLGTITGSTGLAVRG